MNESRIVCGDRMHCRMYKAVGNVEQTCNQTYNDIQVIMCCLEWNA